MSEAPLFVRTFDLVAWLLGHQDDTDVTRVHALLLLDAVVLALKGYDRERNLDDADGAAALLRVRVRLAHQLGTLDDKQLLFAAALQVGRGPLPRRVSLGQAIGVLSQPHLGPRRSPRVPRLPGRQVPAELDLGQRGVRLGQIGRVGQRPPQARLPLQFEQRHLPRQPLGLVLPGA